MLPTDSIESLGSALRDAVSAHRSRTALIEVDRTRESRSLTYGEFEAEAERMAGVLASLGVGPGDRVAVVMSNQSRWLTGATGVFWRSATLVPLDVKLSEPEIALLVTHARPKVLLTEHAVWRTLRDVLKAELERTGCGAGPVAIVAHAPKNVCTNDQEIAWDAEARPDALGGDGTDSEASSGEGPDAVLLTARRDDTACIVYSSGTGGTPKGCMLSHGSYLKQAQGLGALYPMEPGERFFSILPTNHAIDFMTGFLMPLMFGATVVHQLSMRPEHLRYAMRRYGITHMAVVPRILRAFDERITMQMTKLDTSRASLVRGLMRLNEALTLARPRPRLSRALLAPFHEAFGGKLKYVFAGGAYVDPALARRFYEIGIPVVIGYGLTEACTVLTVNDLRPFRPDTVGKPVEGVEVEIRGAGADGVGEVWARGPTIMQGYLDAPELTAETLVDGWLRTGDLGFIDPAGHLHLVGRAKDMIVTDGGKNVYPEDVEALLGNFDGVEELAVFSDTMLGLSTGLSGARLIAVVRPSEDGADDWKTELAERNRTLAAHKRLSGVVVWGDAFPRTASLKLKRAELAGQLARQLPAVMRLEDIVSIKPSAPADGGPTQSPEVT